MWPINFLLPGVPSLVLGVDKQPIIVRRDRLFLQCCSHMLVSMLLQITLNLSPPISIIKLKQYRHGRNPSFHSLVLCLEWVGVCSRLLRRSLHNKHLFIRPFKVFIVFRNRPASYAQVALTHKQDCDIASDVSSEAPLRTWGSIVMGVSNITVLKIILFENTTRHC